MPNNSELISVGHELARRLGKESLRTITNTIARLTNALEMATAAIYAKTKQCEAMVTESINLMDSETYALATSLMLHKALKKNTYCTDMRIT